MKMKKAIIAIIIAVILIGTFYIVASADFPPPPDDSCCDETGWWELWHIPNAKYCNGGDYYILHCRELNSKDVLYTSVCLSSIQIETEIYTVYFPYIVKE